MEKVNRSYFFAAFFLGLVGGVAKAGPIRGKLNALSHLTHSSFTNEELMMSLPWDRVTICYTLLWW